MLTAWHPKRWWKFCMSEDEKKGSRSKFKKRKAHQKT